MIQLEHFLNFNKFKIYQDSDRFKYTLDSILLADFVVKHYRKGKIIDLATGTIPIPLFLQTRLNQKVVAVELQKEICALATKTIQYNGLEDRIELIQGDVRQLKDQYAPDSFDVVICNPPYFSLEDRSLLSKRASKSIARHELTLTLEDIINVSRYLLKDKGKLFLIYRTERIVELLSKLSSNKLEPKTIQIIYSNRHKKSKLFLIEARLNGGKECTIDPPLIVYNDSGQYTKEIIDMLGDGKYDSEKL